MMGALWCTEWRKQDWISKPSRSRKNCKSYIHHRRSCQNLRQCRENIESQFDNGTVAIMPYTLTDQRCKSIVISPYTPKTNSLNDRSSYQMRAHSCLVFRSHEPAVIPRSSPQNEIITWIITREEGKDSIRGRQLWICSHKAHWLGLRWRYGYLNKGLADIIEGLGMNKTEQFSDGRAILLIGGVCILVTAHESLDWLNIEICLIQSLGEGR